MTPDWAKVNCQGGFGKIPRGPFRVVESNFPWKFPDDFFLVEYHGVFGKILSLLGVKFWTA